MNKKELRQYMREKRNALTIREQKLYSDQIAEMVLTSDLYQNLANICVYQAFRNEVSCDKITEQALLDGVSASSSWHVSCLLNLDLSSTWLILFSDLQSWLLCYRL